jgi:two-component system response regulator RegX3
MTRILIVEDEASFSEALAFLLTKEGFEISVAEDGRQALDMFSAQGADLILLDLIFLHSTPLYLHHVWRRRV